MVCKRVAAVLVAAAVLLSPYPAAAEGDPVVRLVPLEQVAEQPGGIWQQDGLWCADAPADYAEALWCAVSPPAPTPVPVVVPLSVPVPVFTG